MTSVSNASSSSSASAVVPNGLQTLPVVMQQMVATNLPIGDVCAFSRTCKSLHTSISATTARETAYLQRDMVAYRSPASRSNHATTLSQLDANIRELEERLRQIRVAPPAAPAALRDPAEEIAVARALNDLRARRLPNDQFPRSIIDLVMGFLDNPQASIRFSLPELPSNAIDTKQWNALIGGVPNRPLLPGTEAFLSRPCSIFPGKTKRETHVCIDIPPTVGGQPLTLNRIRQFAEHNRGNTISLNIHWDRILQQLGDTRIPAGQYFLLKTCLPDTKTKTYPGQLQVLEEEHPEYMPATLLQVLVPALMEYIRSGDAKTRLFDGEYARTFTTVDDFRLGFGGFDSSWPGVPSYIGDDYALNYFGLAVVLRPGGSSPVLGS